MNFVCKFIKSFDWCLLVYSVCVVFVLVSCLFSWINTIISIVSEVNQIIVDRFVIIVFSINRSHEIAKIFYHRYEQNGTWLFVYGTFLNQRNITECWLIEGWNGIDIGKVFVCAWEWERERNGYHCRKRIQLDYFDFWHVHIAQPHIVYVSDLKYSNNNQPESEIERKKQQSQNIHTHNV